MTAYLGLWMIVMSIFVGMLIFKELTVEECVIFMLWFTMIFISVYVFGKGLIILSQ